MLRVAEAPPLRVGQRRTGEHLAALDAARPGVDDERLIAAHGRGKLRPHLAEQVGAIEREAQTEEARTVEGRPEDGRVDDAVAEELGRGRPIARDEGLALDGTGVDVQTVGADATADEAVRERGMLDAAVLRAGGSGLRQRGRGRRRSQRLAGDGVRHQVFAVAQLDAVRIAGEVERDVQTRRTMQADQRGARAVLREEPADIAAVRGAYGSVEACRDAERGHAGSIRALAL